MTELLFRETHLRGRPVSFAIDLELALKFGISGESLRTNTPCGGWHDVSFHLACFVFTFTLYSGG